MPHRRDKDGPLMWEPAAAAFGNIFPMLFRIPLIAFCASMLVSVAACSKAPDRAATALPSISGNRVTFPANSPQRTSLTIAAAEPRPRMSRQVTGRLVWDEDATVRIYSPVEGRVAAVFEKVGDEVKQGTILARLDSPDFGQAQADAHKAAADQQFADRTLARIRDLFEHGAAARKDLETAENASVGAQSEQQRTAARLARYELESGPTVDGQYALRSPMSGMVVEKNLNLGQELRPDLMLANSPLLLAPQFVVSDPSQLWVYLDVTETDLGTLHLGQELRIRSRAFPEQIFMGRLEMIGQALDPATRTLRARGVVNNSERLLKSEMYVDVEINVSSANLGAVSVASNAVFTKDGLRYVFIEVESGSYERREIETGAEAAGRVFVQRGVSEGDRVLIEGSLLVEEILETGGKS